MSLTIDEQRALLLDWANADEVGTRFPRSIYDCPQCKGATLRDDWPPNYGGGSTAMSTDSFISKSGGTIKHVCLNCKVAFSVSWWRNIENNKRDEGHSYHDIEPLVEMNGKWLTPNDVYKEEYKKEHGKYPVEAYG